MSEINTERLNRMANWVMQSTNTLIKNEEGIFHVTGMDDSELVKINAIDAVRTYGWKAAGDFCVREIERRTRYDSSEEDYRKLEENTRLKLQLHEERATNRKRLNEIIVAESELTKARKFLRKLASCKEPSSVPDELWVKLQIGYGPEDKS